MATMPIVNPMPPFDPDSDIGANIGPKWKIWMEDFEMYITANGITDKAKKRALLLYQAGARVREIFRQIPDHGDDKDYDKAVEKLHGYFEPQKHRLYEVYKFREARQDASETLDQYYMRLRSLSPRCEFADPDFEITVQLVLCGRSSRLRKQALRDPKLTLKDLLVLGRQFERSCQQAAEIEENTRNNQTFRTEDVALDAVRDTSAEETPQKGVCRNCGGEWPHNTGICPAKGKECRNCSKPNHFARVCRSAPAVARGQQQNRGRWQRRHEKKPIRPLNVSDNDKESSDSDNYCYAVNNAKAQNPYTKVKINNRNVKFTVDTGSSINIIDQQTFEQLGHYTLSKTNIKAYAFNSKVPVQMNGKFTTIMESRRKITVATIYVTKEDGGRLLSGSTAEELGLISLHLNAVQTPKSSQASPTVAPIKDKGVQRVVEKHPNVFCGLGKLRHQTVELLVDKEVTPVTQRQRRIPFHLRAKVDAELSRLQDEDIIERVPDTEATEWISPIVIVPKKEDKIRLCIDMRAANTAIKRIRHPIPTVQDISHELNGAKFFTKLDLTQAYHQLELAPSSRQITTFITHAGLYRFKRLNYGTNSAAEIFQHALQQVLHDIPGVRNIADDILVFGSSYEAHNKALNECLDRLDTHGLTLNFDKCQFLQPQLEFFGLNFSKDGVRPDPKKVSALATAAMPTTASEVRSLLGMANYSSQFIPNFATITEPLRQLTHKGTPFIWNQEHANAYTTLREALVNRPVMSYFDVNKATEVTVDASPVGLSAILAQRDSNLSSPNIVAYASRALTPTERRYSQTEKEALAVVWGIEHFHLYLYGATFTLYTDHKALEVIFGNPISKPPARIERWFLRLQQYKFRVAYKPGSTNPADYLSRHPPESRQKHTNIADQYVHFITHTAVLPALTVEDVGKATSKDTLLSSVCTAIQTGLWSNRELKQFKPIKDELSIDYTNNVVLRGTRIVLPASLVQHVIQLAHEGHQGQARTKALLREHVWFPEMDKKVRAELETCLACQATGQPSQPEPLRSTPLPNKAWDKLKIDFYGPLPTGQYILVILDCYSRFPEVEVLSSISAKTVIPKLDAVFARHGVPSQVVSDNGPPFQGHEFNRYMTKMGIQHTTSTPLWPQGNAEVEAFMKPLGKAIRTANLEGRPWKQELSKFLLAYRSTPHSTTKVPPAQLLYNREIRGKLPTLPHNSKVLNRHSEAKHNDQEQKKRGRSYADARRHAKTSKLRVGDSVLVRQKKKNKFSTNFSPTPYTIIAIKGSKVVARNQEQHVITRNVSFFKKIAGQTVCKDEVDEDVVNRGREEDGEQVQEQCQQQQQQEPRRSTRNTHQPNFYGRPMNSG